MKCRHGRAGHRTFGYPAKCRTCGQYYRLSGCTQKDHAAGPPFDAYFFPVFCAPCRCGATIEGLLPSNALRDSVVVADAPDPRTRMAPLAPEMRSWYLEQLTRA